MDDAVDINNPNPPAPAPSPAPAPAPVAPPANSGTDEENQEQLTDEQRAEQENSGEDRPKKPIQPRINELVRKAHEAAREAAYWRGIAEGKSKTPSEAPPAPPAAPEKPTPDKFATYEEYVDKLTDWKADRAVEKALTAVNTQIEKRSEQQTAAEQAKERDSNWNKRTEEVRKVIEDYDEVLLAADNVPIAQHVGDLLLDSEFGPAIAYKLAKDPELVQKLNGMTERQAAKEFGKLEATLAASAPAPAPNSEAPDPAPSEKPNVSKAPAPPRPVPQGRSTTKDISKMSMDEYVANRKSLGLAR